MIIMCPIICFSIDITNLVKWLFVLNIKTLLESDIFMGVCSFLSLLVAAIGLFFINKNVISVKKSINNNINLSNYSMYVAGNMIINRDAVSEFSLTKSSLKDIWKN